MTRNIVFMFSGQGTQSPNMGLDLLDIPEIAGAFADASDVLGFDLPYRIEHASVEEINDTRLAQPALCALEIGLARALMARGVMPQAVLGFSLGQVSALAVSGMLSDKETFRFVAKRAEYMAECTKTHPGVMSAFLKGTDEEVREVCKTCAHGDVLCAANYNCAGQVVVSGSEDAISRAEAMWADLGKRVSRLSTSGAFHSPLMGDAASSLALYLEGVTFTEPHICLIDNVSARPLAASCARTQLAKHLTHPVLFSQSVEYLVREGASDFVELGYGKVLCNLVKRIDGTVNRSYIQDRKTFDTYLAARNT